MVRRGGRSATTLRTAATTDDVGAATQALKQMSEMGADILAPDRSGRTTLHYAAEAGAVAITRLLLEARADANYRDKDNGPPLDIVNYHVLKCRDAEKRQRYEAVQELLEQYGGQESACGERKDEEFYLRHHRKAFQAAWARSGSPPSRSRSPSVPHNDCDVPCASSQNDYASRGSAIFQTQTCRSCMHSNRPKARFCEQCGSSLSSYCFLSEAQSSWSTGSQRSRSPRLRFAPGGHSVATNSALTGDNEQSQQQSRLPVQSPHSSSVSSVVIDLENIAQPISQIRPQSTHVRWAPEKQNADDDVELINIEFDLEKLREDTVLALVRKLVPVKDEPGEPSEPEARVAKECLLGALQQRILKEQLGDVWRLDPSVNKDAEAQWMDRIREVDVTMLRNTHSNINAVFKNKPHSGKPVGALFKELVDGRASPTSLPCLVAAEQWGELWVVFGNRRLSVLKRFASHIRQPVHMRVIVHKMPNTGITPPNLERAFLAKFILATTTEDGGQNAPFRYRPQRKR